VSDVIDARTALNRLAVELGDMSSKLAQVCRDLEPVERDYSAFVDEFEVGLLLRSESDEGYKLPSAALRLKLAHRKMDPDLLGRYMGLVNSRSRLQQRLRDLKAEIEAQRSILSALKVEMEATA
jgi:hypothetical protein